MLVNLKRAIKSIDGKIDFLQPLCEGVINSFQANATEIKIKFEKDTNNYILGYSINDNGHGFINRAIDSFLTLWSDYNISKGALGSGRILCLKVFDSMNIESQTKDTNSKDGQKVNIKFNRNFNANSIEDIKPIKTQSESSYTTTNFININEEYLKQNGQVLYNKESIEDEIFIELLPMFIKFKDTKQKFSIKIDNDLFLDTTTLETKFNKSNFKNKSFDIKVDLSQFEQENNDLENIKTYTFNLHYRITKDKDKVLEQFYGASDRNITNFPAGIRFSRIEDGNSGIFCLTSEYFEENRVKDSRNEFIIGIGNNNSKSKENPITFPEINKQLLLKMNELLKEEFPKIENKFEEQKLSLVEKYPHLERYIKNIDSLTMSESDILKKAEQNFFKQTKKTRLDVEKFTNDIKKDINKFSDKKFKEITNHFTQTGIEQLADYIGYRQTIIEMLLEIYDNTGIKKINILEKNIHNLFMPMGSTSNTSSYYANNIWIFDDKFMSYSYAASDKTIAKIVKDVADKDRTEIKKEHRDKEPDLIMFYSNPENEYKDVLLIEFKKLNGTIDDKEKAINQINRYPRYIDENIDKIRSIFTYTILDIDKELADGLTKELGFIENAFGDSENKISAYYKYNPSVKAHINVVSFSQIIKDADKRNKVFLNILKENYQNK